MSSKHIVCAGCGAVNRIPSDKLTAAPKCGKCKAPLFSGYPVELNDANFSKFIHKNEVPVVVDFWADWCGPCKMMAPFFADAAKQLEPHYRLAKLNTELARQTAAQYQIRSIPTLMVFKNGQMVAQQAGAMQTRQLIDWIRSVA